MNSAVLFRILAVLSLLVGASAYLFLVRHDPVAEITLSDRPELRAAVPVGEITQGFRAVQRVNTKFAAQRRTYLGDEVACVELLMANYSNRLNEGQLYVDLVLDGEAFTQQIEAMDVHDNTIHSFCFDTVSVGALFDARDVLIVLRGSSSPLGAAVTAWTTPDLSVGRLVDVPEPLQSRSLVFHFSAHVASHQMRFSALLLIVIGALAAATVLMPWPRTARPHRVMRQTRESK